MVLTSYEQLKRQRTYEITFLNTIKKELNALLAPELAGLCQIGP
jgi:hypothetical protein